MRTRYEVAERDSYVKLNIVLSEVTNTDELNDVLKKVAEVYNNVFNLKTNK